jgi:hypothetical protein
MADVSDTEHGGPTLTPEQQLANADPRPFLTRDWLGALESRLATQAEAPPNSTAAAVIREALGKTFILVIGLPGPDAKPATLESYESALSTDMAHYWTEEDGIRKWFLPVFTRFDFVAAYLRTNPGLVSFPVLITIGADLLKSLDPATRIIIDPTTSLEFTLEGPHVEGNATVEVSNPILEAPREGEVLMKGGGTEFRLATDAFNAARFSECSKHARLALLSYGIAFSFSQDDPSGPVHKIGTVYDLLSRCAQGEADLTNDPEDRKWIVNAELAAMFHEAAVSSSPDSFEYRRELALSRLRLIGQPRDGVRYAKLALDDFDYLLKQSPRDPRLLYGRGLCRNRLGILPGAEDDLTTALDSTTDEGLRDRIRVELDRVRDRTPIGPRWPEQ